MKAIILARVSTEEQKEANNSLPAQLHRLNEYCDKKGLEVDKTFSFDETAYKTKRTQFDDFIDYVLAKKEKVAVCFDKVDRLSRSVFDKRVSALYDLAVENKLELHFVSDSQVIDSSMNAGDKFMFGIKLGLAKYFSDAISDTVKRAFEEKVRKGEILTLAPYGYKNFTDEDGNKDVLLVVEEAKVVKQMFIWYASGVYSMQTLRTKVYDEFGLSFHIGKVDSILKNPFYYGQARYKDTIYPHKYATLLDEELFNNVQILKQGKALKPRKHHGLPYLYRGLLKCAECGCAITPEKHKGKYVYYKCTNYYKKHVEKPVYVPEDYLTEQFAIVFNQMQIPTDVIEQVKETINSSHQGKIETREREIKNLRDQADKLDKRQQNALIDKLDGRITEDMYDRVSIQTQRERRIIDVRLKRLNTADETYYLSCRYLIRIIEKAPEIFKSSEMEEKRELIGLALQNLQLEGKKLHYEPKKPFSSILEFAKHSKWGPLVNAFSKREIEFDPIFAEMALLSLDTPN